MLKRNNKTKNAYTLLEENLRELLFPVKSIQEKTRLAFQVVSQVVSLSLNHAAVITQHLQLGAQSQQNLLKNLLLKLHPLTSIPSVPFSSEFFLSALNHIFIFNIEL